MTGPIHLTVGTPPGGPVSSTIEARIRAAYATFQQPGRLVRLAALRPLLADLPRPDVDAALDDMIVQADVWIVGEANQKTLSRADRAPAVEIGGELHYYLAIGPWAG